jgi:hypothetical protein
VGRGWHRVRGTPLGVQTWESDPYETEVVQADDTDAAGDQLRHAKEQITIGSRYPGRERSVPSGAKLIALGAAKR